MDIWACLEIDEGIDDALISGEEDAQMTNPLTGRFQ